MSQFYDRVFELRVDDETFIGVTQGRQFRVTFDIVLDFGGYISYADISIANLSQGTINRVLKKGLSVTLRAGYTDTIDTLFRGRIRNVFKERSGATVLTRIIARGGTQPDTTVTKTLGTGTTITAIIREIARAMGYPLVIREQDFANVSPYIRGYALSGDPRAHLDRLADTHAFSYVIENERLVVTRDNGYRDGSIIRISETNGMEGIPEITEIGCDVNLRLNPKIRIGGRVDIQSEYSTFNFSNLYFQDIPPNAGQGIYRVFKLQHTGDTWGDTWTTRITGYR